MGHNPGQYLLSLIMLVFFAAVIFLGAPLIGLILLLVSGSLIYRSRTASSSVLEVFLKWFNRNRYLLALAILLSVLSGFVLVSSSLQAKSYGLPVSFVIYYPQTPKFSGPLGLLSAAAIRVPAFFLNVAFYYVLIWIVLRIWRSIVRTA